MKHIILAGLLCLGLVNSVWAYSENSSHHHVKHNMVLFGESEIFASHIVYKDPHHFSLILGLTLDEETRRLYLSAKKEHPSSLFIFLLNPIDIREITSLDSITGSILFRDDKDQAHIIQSEVTVTKGRFHVIYFDELPLSLKPDTDIFLHGIGSSGYPVKPIVNNYSVKTLQATVF